MRAPISGEELERLIANVKRELSYAALCSAQIVNQEGKLVDTVRVVERQLTERQA